MAAKFMQINFPQKISLKASHLPTMLLIVGYAMFWVELYFVRLPLGHTSWAAWIIFGLLVIGMLLPSLRQWPLLIAEARQWWNKQGMMQKFFLSLFFALAFIVLFVASRASFLPPHLPQEYDFLNYHLTIPRQHLIMGSFAHLPWSVADFYLLPLDFAIAPYCLATEFPSKLVFYFFVLGILGVSASLTWKFSKQNVLACLAVVIAILGSHGISIQFGVAMFDLVMLYLFLAAVDSFFSGNWGLAAVESSFYIWSKSFVPIQIFILGVVLFGTYFILKKRGWQLIDSWKIGEIIKSKKIWIAFVISSFLVGGPFVAKNLCYTGTPLYPFVPGMVSGAIYENAEVWPSIIKRGRECTHIKDQYGKGRGLKQLAEHFWILSVPEKNVNNRFDYPLGLPYLLVLLPFIFAFAEDLKNRKINLALWFCFWYWVFWWLGSQQSRFLYIPLVIMFIVVLSDQRFLCRSMLLGLLISLVLCCLSIVRAHKADFLREPEDVLRGRDKTLIEMSTTVDRGKPAIIDFEDAAFADFAVDIVQPGSIFILER